MGTPLFPAQQYVYDVALEVQSEEVGDPAPGEWAYDVVGDFEPRRSGKTFKMGPLVAHGCGRPGVRHTAWITAQKRTNAVARWLDVANAIRATSLRAQTRMKIGNGHELLRWPETGSTFQPFAPSHDSMHGEDPDRVFVDELWAFDLEQKSSIEQGYLPAGAVKQIQVWLLSAAGTDESAWLNLQLELGRRAVAEGRRLGTAHFEWAVPDEVDGIPIEEVPDDVMFQAVVDSHPRRDHGLRLPFLRNELERAGREDFLRAYGNRRTRKGSQTIFPMVKWRAGVSEMQIPPTSRIALAFECDPEGMEATISASWRDANGTALTELVKREDGMLWVPAEVVRLVKEHRVGLVAVNNAGPAKDMADKVAHAMRAAGLDPDSLLLRVTGPDYAAACNRFKTELVADVPLTTHDGDPALLEAMRAAGWRTLGGGQVLSKRGAAPIAALVSHVIAVWAVDHMPVEPARFRIA